MQRNQKESPFLRLPGELRNKIYRYYLNTASIDVKFGDTIYSIWSKHRFSNWPEHAVLTSRENNLPLACRQIYQESQLFGRYHSLKFITGDHFDFFMTAMYNLSRRRNLGAIREIEVGKITALDMISCYEDSSRRYDDWMLWTNQSSPLHLYLNLPRVTNVFPALKVVVWPCTASEMPIEKREVAVRYCFNRSDIQIVLGST